MLDKLQKQICRTVGPWHAASLEPLFQRRSVPSLSLPFRYCFGRCSSELTQLVPRLYSRGRSTPYFDRLHDFSVIIPRCYKDVYANSFFPRTVFICKSFLDRFPVCFNLVVLHSFETPSLIVTVYLSTNRWI